MVWLLSRGLVALCEMAQCPWTTWRWQTVYLALLFPSSGIFFFPFPDSLSLPTWQISVQSSRRKSHTTCVLGKLSGVSLLSSKWSCVPPVCAYVPWCLPPWHCGWWCTWWSFFPWGLMVSRDHYSVELDLLLLPTMNHEGGGHVQGESALGMLSVSVLIF